MLPTTAAIIVAVVFCWSGISKLRNVDAAQQAATALIDAALPRAVAPALIGVELLTSVLCLVPKTRTIGAAAAVALLSIFTVLLARSLRQGRKPTCFCFGSVSAAPISWLDVARNIALAAIAAVVLLA